MKRRGVSFTALMLAPMTAAIVGCNEPLVGEGGEAVVTAPIWKPVASMSEARSGHGATLLPGEKVLVMSAFSSLNTELYDRALDTFRACKNTAGQTG